MFSKLLLRILLPILVVTITSSCYSFNQVNLSPFERPSRELRFRQLYTEAEGTSCFGTGKPQQRILLIPIHGVISDENEREGTTPSGIYRLLKMAKSDRDIKAILLQIDSPGGTVTASDLIYRMIGEFAKKRKLPVYAHIDSLAASGGYYVGMAADNLNVVPTGRVGSIGVILTSFNAAGLLEKVGVKERSIKSGKNKDTLSPFRELREDEREFLQKQIDEMYGRFFGIVAEGRKGKITTARLRELADGRVLTAAEAVAEKLVDSGDYLDDYLKRIKKKEGFTSIEVISYLPEGNRAANLYEVRAPRILSPTAMLMRLTGADVHGLLYLWRGGL